LRDWQAKNYKTPEDIRKVKTNNVKKKHSSKRKHIRTELAIAWLKEYQQTKWEATPKLEEEIDVELLKER
jgi:hypothetical protein